MIKDYLDRDIYKLIVKNFSFNEYIHATALEALFGYLHLAGETERLEYFLNKSLEELKTDI